jgi:hypothetical protein
MPTLATRLPHEGISAQITGNIVRPAFIPPPKSMAMAVTAVLPHPVRHPESHCHPGNPRHSVHFDSASCPLPNVQETVKRPLLETPVQPLTSVPPDAQQYCDESWDRPYDCDDVFVHAGECEDSPTVGREQPQEVCGPGYRWLHHSAAKRGRGFHGISARWSHSRDEKMAVGVTGVAVPTKEHNVQPLMSITARPTREFSSHLVATRRSMSSVRRFSRNPVNVAARSQSHPGALLRHSDSHCTTDGFVEHSRHGAAEQDCQSTTQNTGRSEFLRASLERNCASQAVFLKQAQYESDVLLLDSEHTDS